MLGADRAEQIGRLRALIMDGAGPRAGPRPAIGQLVLLADPHLILEPDLYRRARREVLSDVRNARGEVFLNAAIASASCLYARGRALRCEKPSLCKAR